MLRRHLNSDFVGGAFVFPGGKVDEADRSDLAKTVCAGRTERRRVSSWTSARGVSRFVAAPARVLRGSRDPFGVSDWLDRR